MPPLANAPGAAAPRGAAAWEPAGTMRTTADPSGLPSPLTGRDCSAETGAAAVPASPAAAPTRHGGMPPGRAAAQPSHRQGQQ